MRHIIPFIITISLLLTPLVIPAQAGIQTDQSTILTGRAYFERLHESLDQAKDSIYVAMYIINIAPEPRPDNPAYILMQDLVNANERGVYVKVLLDDSKLAINYNAYKLLKNAGIDVSFDSPARLLHGKAVVIDSHICIIGSFNWTKASLYNNHEYAAYIESPEEAEKLIGHMKEVRLSHALPVSEPAEEKGVMLPVSVIANPVKQGEVTPPLSRLFTSHAEKSFDLYLYLLKKAQDPSSSLSFPLPRESIPIDYKELGQALGYTENYYFHVFQPLFKLTHRYGLTRHRPWSKHLTIVDSDSPSQSISIPYTYWTYNYNNTLSFPAKYLYLIALNEARSSSRSPYWFRSNADIALKYHIGERSITKGISELEKENILEVYRSRPEEYSQFQQRPANTYRLNPLTSENTYNSTLKGLSDRYGEDILQKAQKLSGMLDEPKDTEKIETYIGLIQKYGYKRVLEVNQEVAKKRKETGFRSIEQVISLLGQ